ncbi:family 43 glycosylhydrolase [Paraglaciecola sp.]|uniref:family 43 glycosylhydrolase n=1 Tax=Paraglaciecola sp. TaxID=1920173 RepID=UPI003EF13B6D
MKIKILVSLCLSMFLLGCNNASQEKEQTDKPQKVLIPKQANEFVWIYKPKGDTFFGPDTQRLKKGEWYDNWVPNDHTFIKGDSGEWHIFGITHPYVPPLPKSGVHEGEMASFHAVSTAKHFKQTIKTDHYLDKAKVLPPHERPGEPLSNHAPTIVKKDGLFHMIYGPSPIRLAVSSDLYKWQLKGNLFSEENGARDPSLLFHNGTYYIVYCTEKSVALRTSKDLVNWSEPKIIFTANTYDPESPTLVFHNNTFYLFVCSWNGIWDGKDIQGAYQHTTYVLNSNDPMNFGVGDEQQITTLEGHAPEIFQDEDGDWYISSVEWPNRGVSVDRLVWE